MMNKKLMLLLAFASVSLGVSAQEKKHSVSTNTFWANWFVQGGVTWNAWYGVGEKTLVAPFRKFPTGKGHTGLGASLAVGKWFTPGIALRTKVNVWQIGTKVDGVKADKYWAVSEQVMFNLSNMLLGYKEKRLWNMIPYVGGGIFRNTTQKQYRGSLSIGLLNTLRLSPKLAAHVDFGLNSYEGSGGLSMKSRNRQFFAEVGVTYRIGRHGWTKTPDVESIQALSQSEIDALNAQLQDMTAENDRLQQELAAKSAAAPQVAPVTAAKAEAPKVVAAPVSIFFDLGKAVVVTQRDRENVAAVAKTAVEHNLRVVLTGYADSKTGTAEVNQRLSQQRADAVADQLVKLGVSRDRIETHAAGGVSTLNTTENNRRVVVELK